MVAARTYVPDRGDLVWLSFDPQVGREQAGHRPALVHGAVPSDHLKSLDWRARRASFACKAPAAVTAEVRAMLHALL